MSSASSGQVLSPVITPFKPDLSPDVNRLTIHCRWLLDNDVGLTVFGTNSEANSLSLADRERILDLLAEAGLPGEQMMPGTGFCSIEETVALTRQALSVGADRVLMLPPFYYKGVSDEGLLRYYSEVIERVGEARLRIYLYHIPQFSNVSITHTLIGRLLAAYPKTIAGIKDSSGDWDHTRMLIENFASTGFRVFAASERFLMATLRAGGAGCISATANVNPGLMARLATDWHAADAEAQQAALVQVRDIFESVPMIPALKAVMAYFSADTDWARVRPPLVQLSDKQRGALMEAINVAGLEMPGRAVA